MHGAAGVHPQAVGHARAGAAVAGAGSPPIVGGSGIVTWKEMAHKMSLEPL